MQHVVKHVSSEQELDAALALYKEVFGIKGSHSNSPYSREKWLERMASHGDLMLCSESGGKVIAIVFGRIDMSIGEKAYWNKGIGTQFIGMMVDFAFCGENVDVLHCFCEDYNIRSRRMWEKHGFTRVLEEPLEPQPQKGKWQYHYRLTRQEYIERRRAKVPADQQFTFPLTELQPSQLYISEGKLRLVREWFTPDNIENFDPIPIKRFGGRLLMTDGHTRAVAAHLAGWDRVPVYWDEDDLDMRAYEIDVKWCSEEGITNPGDLSERIVPHKDYERMWRKRCMEMTL